MYKMVKICKKTWDKNGVEVIIFNGNRWLNENHIQTQLENSNLLAVTNKCSLQLKKKDKNNKIVAIINLLEDF